MRSTWFSLPPLLWLGTEEERHAARAFLSGPIPSESDEDGEDSDVEEGGEEADDDGAADDSQSSGSESEEGAGPFISQEELEVLSSSLSRHLSHMPRSSP